MSDIEAVADALATELKKYSADYLEARLEESQTSHITYRGKELDSIGRSSNVGGNVRALIRGGWGFTSFNSLEKLAGRVSQAVEQAKSAGTGDSIVPPVEIITDRVPAGIEVNPVNIPLAEKKSLLDEYNEIIWRTPRIQTSNINYADSRRKVIYLNSAGSYIVQERADVSLGIFAIAARDGEVQQAMLSVGSRGDFNAVRNLHDKVETKAKHAVEALSAPQAKGGEYTVVADPLLGGVFAHEAFGHLSEADFVYENERMREIMKLGKQFGSKDLNIIDSAALPGYRGSYKYDDEGTPAAKNYLIKEGKLVGRLHSRETAIKMNEPLTGNARALNYSYAPLVRMTNTYIEPGDVSFEDMISDIKEGIYAKDCFGGTTAMEMFTFSAEEAYMIRDGKIAETLRPVMLTGNVFNTLANIDAIGNDLFIHDGAGGCGKGGQMPLPVSTGSPHLRIQKCLIGGS
ncbi:MAG: TldD/PmbA family protein [Dehalococcoidia bacterium]|jgi:TldD protein